MLVITREQARRFLLIHQGLYPPKSIRIKDDIVDYIRRVGCIQFDPIDVAGRNADLVLQSRVAEYHPGILDGLLYTNRSLVDGYDKNMSIYGAEDWPYFRRRREDARVNLASPDRPVAAVFPHIRRELEDRGPLSSIDIDLDGRVDWAWSPTRIARAALESMYLYGELVIHHKVNTRKVYDFAVNHLPGTLLDAPDPNQTDEDYHEWYLYRRIGGIGMIWNKAGDAWLGMGDIKTPERTRALERLVRKGRVLEIKISEIGIKVYMRSEDLPTLETAIQQDFETEHAVILAPLDNLIWDRKFIELLFDFSYTWEIYKPAKERQFGYYVLPILFGDRFVARFEPVRDRTNGNLIIQNWWWEPGIMQTKDMQAAVRDACLGLMKFNSCKKMEIREEILISECLDWLR